MRAVLRKSTRDFCAVRDARLGAGRCRVGIENGYRFCGGPDIPAYVPVYAGGWLDAVARACVPYVFHALLSGEIDTTRVCSVCPNCLRAIRERKVGIAGNANEHLSITDARDDTV